MPGPSSGPVQANLLLTGLCNLDCPHCGVPRGRPAGEDLPPTEWGAIADRLAEAGVLYGVMTGGEPLARDDFPELLAELTARPLRLSLNTNATLVDEEAARCIAGAGPRLGGVSVSLDGPTVEVHDAMRGEGAFDAMMEGVARLCGAGVGVSFYCTVSSVNIDHLEETVRLAGRMGGGVRLNYVSDVGACSDPELLPTSSQLRRASSVVLRLLRDGRHRMSGVLVEASLQAAMLRSGRARVMEGRSPCRAPAMKIAVWPDGSVSPCDFVPEPVLGRLPGQSVAEVLSSPAADAYSERAGRRRYLMHGCGGCSLRPYCHGPCIAVRERDDEARYAVHCLRSYLPDEED